MLIVTGGYTATSRGGCGERCLAVAGTVCVCEGWEGVPLTSQLAPAQCAGSGCPDTALDHAGGDGSPRCVLTTLRGANKLTSDEQLDRYRRLAGHQRRRMMDDTSRA